MSLKVRSRRYTASNSSFFKARSFRLFSPFVFLYYLAVVQSGTCPLGACFARYSYHHHEVIRRLEYTDVNGARLPVIRAEV